MRKSISTPCPGFNGYPIANDGRAQDDNTTADLNYTAAFRSSFRNVKPKRRRSTLNFTIHEDICASNDEVIPQKLARPAKRNLARPSPRESSIFATTNSTRCTNPVDCEQVRKVAAESNTSQRAMRTKGRISIVPEVVWEEEQQAEPVKAISKFKKPARRGTIYIPNDDTILPSMYMGIFSPVKNLEISEGEEQPCESALEITGIAARMAQKRSRRTSIMNAPPKRLPLQASRDSSQENNPTHDRPGAKTGKENVPPSSQVLSRAEFASSKKCTVETGARRLSQMGPKAHGTSQSKVRPSQNYSLHRSHESVSSARRASVLEETYKIAQVIPQHKPAWNSGIRQQKFRPRLSMPVRNDTTAAHQSVLHANQVSVNQFRLATPVVKAEPHTFQYDILKENITDPSMYEDRWVEHQEIALSQLLTSFFQSSNIANAHSITRVELRGCLLGVYNTTEIIHVYKKVQAAILYGSLSMPGDTLQEVSTMHNDIGRRKQFIDFWTKTYNSMFLETALEVITGRKLYPGSVRSSTDSSEGSIVGSKSVRHFIMTFLLRNDDHHRTVESDQKGIETGHRTLLRSLMLIKALDLCKTALRNTKQSLLFLTTSGHKTSESVAQTLLRMLNPSVGDPIRALKHLGFQVGYCQPAMQEVDFSIHNLAVDLRDGVRLTRLVELLLYPSVKNATQDRNDPDSTTILMPEGDSVDIDSSELWPLSQHLKFPCASRAAKLWNVHIALGALRSLKGIGSFCEEVTCDDIVDGYREKTLKLLWSITSTWGMIGLLDWSDIRFEIRRMRLKGISHKRHIENKNDDLKASDVSSQSCKTLLMEWARNVLEVQGIIVRNFTTEFSRHEAFHGILNEYEPFLCNEPTEKNMSLVERLSKIGCTNQFLELFKPNRGEKVNIFGEDFVLASLAFLCSRLLAASKLVRAALVIQSAWRKHWKTIQQRRQAQKKQVAQECAYMVNIKHSAVSRWNSGCATMDAGSEIEADIWLSV